MGYRSDDGHILVSDHPKPFGPPFHRGDTVGCGVNFARRVVFFTKNGTSVGSPLPFPEPPSVSSCRHINDSTNKKYAIYPSMSLSNPGDQLSVNFGCPNCYWLLGGSCGLQLLSPKRENLGELDELLDSEGELNCDIRRFVYDDH